MKKINNLKEYLYKIKDGEKVYNFLTTIDEGTPKGRYDFNEKLYCNVVSYETKESFDGIFECHKEYVDFHVLIAGEEKIYYGDRSTMDIEKQYDSKDDYELLKGGQHSFVSYEKMQGVEFLVNETHQAAIAVKNPQKVLKVIVKIK